LLFLAGDASLLGLAHLAALIGLQLTLDVRHSQSRDNASWSRLSRHCRCDFIRRAGAAGCGTVRQTQCLRRDNWMNA